MSASKWVALITALKCTICERYQVKNPFVVPLTIKIISTQPQSPEEMSACPPATLPCRLSAIIIFLFTNHVYDRVRGFSPPDDGYRNIFIDNRRAAHTSNQFSRPITVDILYGAIIIAL